MNCLPWMLEPINPRMSVLFNRLQVPQDNVRILIERLTIERQQKTFFMKGVDGLPMKMVGEGEPIMFLSSSDAHIIVPFFYASLLTEKLGFFRETPPLQLTTAETREAGDLSPSPPLSPSSPPSSCLREGQEDVAREVMGHLLKSRSLTLQLPTGYGKTVIGSEVVRRVLAILAALGDPEALAVVIVPRKNLVVQWEASIKTVLRDVSLLQRMIITTPGILLKTLGDKVKSVKILVLDESHMLCTKGCVLPILSMQPDFVMAMSATPTRPDGLEKMMTALVGRIIVSREPQVSFRVIPFHVDITVEEPRTTRGISVPLLCGNLSRSDEMNQTVLNIILKFRERKFIVMTKLVKHAEFLCERIKVLGISCDTFCGAKEKYNDSDVLIGTPSKLGTGFDESKCCANFGGRPSDTIIMFHTTNTPQAFNQYNGRQMRSLDPVMFILVSNNEITRRHVSSLKKYIEKDMGGVVLPVARSLDNITL